ncbi:SGNH/GDSL hydrolase family protein [Silvibacterium dinghuense]|nr:SGNH/GDSL hydrolase family protein [Silvibacterium dinghuense]
MFATVLMLSGCLPLAAQEAMPVFHPHDVVLFQGDSITDGGRWIGSQDLNHTMGQSYAYLIAAEMGEQFPERDLQFLNRGISGNRAIDLEKRWQTDTLALKPNLLSILVGINDFIVPGETLEQYETTYDHLISETLSALPGIKIVLGEPFLMPVGKHHDNYAAELAEVKKRQDVVAKLAAKYHLPEVMYQDALNKALKRAPADYWSWDGVHETYAGHELMARTWLETVNAFWPRG